MILAKHLMVGNLFTDDQNEILKIDLIDSIEETVNANGMENISISDLIPIPLTEDILLKCGFELIKNGWYKIQYFTDCNEATEIMEVQLNVITGRCGIGDVDFGGANAMTGKPILHLHTLQNLVHSLTQKELTVQL